jgi:hypothetical protein
MNITSYNITDVGYHYIGLRVLAASPTVPREEQDAAVAKNVAKYASDKALRLMLPGPRSSFSSVGDKVLQELAHLQLAKLTRGKGYVLTTLGTQAVEALNGRLYDFLRRLMGKAHLETYDNLRQVVFRHVHHGPIFSPIVEAARTTDPAYLTGLLRPTFGESVSEVLQSLSNELANESSTPKKVEDSLRSAILSHLFPDAKLSLPLFRAMTDRLVSLRLLNVTRDKKEGCEWAKSYTPCVAGEPVKPWHKELEIQTDHDTAQIIYLSEPLMTDPAMQRQLLHAIEEGYANLPAAAGYYDLPELRDFVCEKLLIPEAAFDDGVNALLDKQPPSLTVGLQYERISGRRKPLVRSRETTQIYNLIRRA